MATHYKHEYTLFAARVNVLACLVLLSSGCVTSQYRYGRFKNSLQPFESPDLPIITYDNRHPVLDRMECVIHTPIETVAGVVGLKDQDPRSRETRIEESVAGTVAYLSANDMNDVYIDVRRYAPKAQWKRLRQNKNIHPVWKYSLGTAFWALETTLPGRAFRYSYYNPFTNTLAVNSVWHEWNQYEAARAKDFLGVSDAGAYAALLLVPFAPIIQETRAGTDALTYARATGNRELELELYPFVYGEVFGATVEEAAFLVPGLSGISHYAGPLIWAGCFATGYGIGSVVTESRRSSMQDDGN